MSNIRYLVVMLHNTVPGRSKKEQNAANRFKRYLTRNGYKKELTNVYSRPVVGEEGMEKQLSEIADNMPDTGCPISFFQLKAEQYEGQTCRIKEDAARWIEPLEL